MAGNKRRKATHSPNSRFAANAAYDMNANNCLLRLPAELRNLIYDCICINTEEVCLARDGLIQPSMARTCQQLRKEFLAVFQATILGYASSARQCVTNFAFPDVHSSSDYRVSQPYAQAIRRRTIVLKLTNTFDNYTSDLRQWLAWFDVGSPILQYDWSYKVTFDPHSFDLDFFERFLARVRFSIRYTRQEATIEFDKILEAMDAAITRVRTARIASRSVKSRKQTAAAKSLIPGLKMPAMQRRQTTAAKSSLLALKPLNAHKNLKLTKGSRAVRKVQQREGRQSLAATLKVPQQGRRKRTSPITGSHAGRNSARSLNTRP